MTALRVQEVATSLAPLLPRDDEGAHVKMNYLGGLNCNFVLIPQPFARTPFAPFSPELRFDGLIERGK